MADIKKPLIILTGPTAVGKTALSINFAKAINGAVISADSMQVYRGMDIGSAKITKEEMDGVPHYLIDILDPSEDFNVVLFQKYAKEALEDIYSKGMVPIVTGGTGFYIQALLYDIDFTSTDEDTALRDKLSDIAKTNGASYLHNMLREVDPESADAIHMNNEKRVIRALEYFYKTGEKISLHNEEQRANESPYAFKYFVLNDDRDILYQKIEKRIDIMLESGLIDEVKALRDKGFTRDMVSMQGLGYKEILDYLNGQITLDEAIAILKRDTRHFAKRQLTWFRREKEVIWINKPDFDHDEEKILSFCLEQTKDILQDGK